MKFIKLTDRDLYNKSTYINIDDIVGVENIRKNYKLFTRIYIRNGTPIEVAEDSDQVMDYIARLEREIENK